MTQPPPRPGTNRTHARVATRARAVGTRWLVPVLLVIGACRATPYQPLGRNGGYSVTRMDSTSYRIVVDVNVHTEPRRAGEYFVRRAGELCRERGFDGFVVIDSATTRRSAIRWTGPLQGETADRTRFIGRMQCARSA